MYDTDIESFILSKKTTSLGKDAEYSSDSEFSALDEKNH